MVNLRWTAGTGLPSGSHLVRNGVAFGLGFLVVPAVIQVLAGGPAATFVLVGIGGFVSVLVRPGWWGFIWNVAGLTAFTTLEAAMASFAGLQYLALALMIPPIAVGGACATIVNHVRAQGFSKALSDRRLWAASALAIVLVAGWVWLYVGLVTSDSPP